jgi:tRNA-dihydrouridine synthase A
METGALTHRESMPRFSVAPMVAVTTRQHRYFTRLLSRHATLYTEMIVAESIVHGKDDLVDQFLDPCADGPVVLQIAGRNPENIATAIRKAELHNFSAINLNCGCPSKRAAVSGAFGVAMMKEPELVGEIVRIAKRVTQVPITVKCRLGVDSHDTYEHVTNFIGTVLGAGADRVSVHARKGVLGLNTKNNRSIPQLRYDWVNQLCQDFPDAKFDINGGINSLDEAKERVFDSGGKVDGVMLGRSLWRDPLILARVDTEWFGKEPTGLPRTRRELLEAFCERFDGQAELFPVFATTEALQGLCLGTRGASAFRKSIAKQRKTDSLREVIDRVFEDVPADVLDEDIRQPKVEEVDEGRKAVDLKW